MLITCSHVDTCLPDYWSGHHLPYVQIPVHKGMPLKAIKESIMDEVKFGYVQGSSADARLLSADYIPDETDFKRAELLTKKIYASINKIKPSKKGQRKFFTDLEEIDDNDYCDSVYAYFVFVIED